MLGLKEAYGRYHDTTNSAHPTDPGLDLDLGGLYFSKSCFLLCAEG